MPVAPAPGSVTLTTAYGYTGDATFIGQLIMAVAANAQQIIQETPSSRTNYARLVQANPVAYVNASFTYAFFADLVSTTSDTDTQILDRVYAIWDFLSTGY